MSDTRKTLEQYLWEALPPSPDELLPSTIIDIIRAAVRANPDLLDELEPDDGAMRTKDVLDNAFDQLRRYGGAPDKRVLALVGVLTDINDDIWHSRSPMEKIGEARKILGQIEVRPELVGD